MSELEFQRALNPDQMREALSLLDGAARAKFRNVQVGDSNPAEEVRPGSDHASTTTATPNRLLAAEDAYQRRKRLNLVLVFYGLGIAAVFAGVAFQNLAILLELLPIVGDHFIGRVIRFVFCDHHLETEALGQDSKIKWIVILLWFGAGSGI